MKLRGFFRNPLVFVGRMGKILTMTIFMLSLYGMKLEEELWLQTRLKHS